MEMVKSIKHKNCTNIFNALYSSESTKEFLFSCYLFYSNYGHFVCESQSLSLFIEVIVYLPCAEQYSLNFDPFTTLLVHVHTLETSAWSEGVGSHITLTNTKLDNQLKNDDYT